MRKESVTKVMIFDQGNPVAAELAAKAACLFNDGEHPVEIITVKNHRYHNAATETLEHFVRLERPELLLIGATALGEEIAPSLGIRLGTGVAAHCVDITVNEEGRMAYMVPAFGGKVIGEIFIPAAGKDVPAIATVKPGMFQAAEGVITREIDVDGLIDVGKLPEGEKKQGSFQMVDISRRRETSGDIGRADIVFCGGFGIGSEENWKKLEAVAEKYGGGAGCTRPVADAGWGASESCMIGTSGRTVRPKVYVGFGISGAAHHMCGIKDADVIVSINSDRNAEVFAASDYKGVFEAGAVLDELLGGGDN